MDDEAWDELKETLLDEFDLIVILALLAVGIALNVLSFLGVSELSFQRVVEMNMLVISLTLVGYVAFDLKRRAFGDRQSGAGPERIEAVADALLTEMLAEIGTDERSSDRTVQDLLTKRSRVFAQTKREAYNFATELAKGADRKLIVHERSPMLLLGPRRYGPDPTYHYEHEETQYGVLTDLLERSVRGDLQFYSSFNVADTRSEYRDEDHRRRVAARLRALVEHSRHEGSGFQLQLSAPGSEPMFSFFAEDDRFALWFSDPGNSSDYICITSTDETATEVFRLIFDERFETVGDYDAVAETLDLGDVAAPGRLPHPDSLPDLPTENSGS